MTNFFFSHRWFTLCAVPLLVLSCSKKNEFAPPPPTPVGVQSPIIRDQATYFEFPGHLVAMKTVQLRARVKGTLLTISPDFKAGRKVKKGTALFKIDDIQYRSALNNAEALLAKAKADLNIAQITLKRRTTAAEAISQIQIDIAKADVESAKAIVQSAEARVIEAKDTLSWCTIKAPFTGRISELEVDQFNLVGSNGETELCTMVSDDKLRVYFDINERAALKFLKNRKSETEEHTNPTLVTLTLANGEVYPIPAAIDYADVRVNSATGTARIRAIVPNPKGELVAGLFVQVKIPNPDPGKNSILIPNIAIQRDLGGDFVLVVTQENKVQRINIKLGDRVDRDRIVKEGLTGKEKIITQGFQRVREGMTVTPQPVQKTQPPADQPAQSTPPAKPEK
jgi:membrane fusion protein (multidrug efflux system)